MPPPPPHPPLARTAAIVVAAGDSTRMGRVGGRRKPLVELAGKTVLERACAAFAATEAVEEIVVVAHSEDIAAVRALCEARPALAAVRAVVEGGELRTDSVRAGVEASGADVELVAIHDAARPLVDAATVREAIRVATARGAALVATPASDTVKESLDGKVSVRTLDRRVLWFAQTPQVFARERFLELLARARAEGVSPTDDAALWEHYVGPVPLVRGRASNLKLTTSSDLEIAEALLLRMADRREEEP